MYVLTSEFKSTIDTKTHSRIPTPQDTALESHQTPDITQGQTILHVTDSYPPCRENSHNKQYQIDIQQTKEWIESGPERDVAGDVYVCM